MLKTGLTHETKVKVEKNMTAGALRSGLVPVLATPVLLAIIENTCYECVMDHLGPGQTLSLIHISEPTRQESLSRMPSSA